MERVSSAAAADERPVRALDRDTMQTTSSVEHWIQRI